MGIRELFKKMSDIDEKKINELQKDVDYIKSNNIKDVEYIENTLNRILSTNYIYCPNIYFDLYNYYANLQEGNYELVKKRGING